MDFKNSQTLFFATKNIAERTVFDGPIISVGAKNLKNISVVNISFWDMNSFLFLLGFFYTSGTTGNPKAQFYLIKTSYV